MAVGVMDPPIGLQIATLKSQVAVTDEKLSRIAEALQDELLGWLASVFTTPTGRHASDHRLREGRIESRHRGAGVVEPFHLIVADPDRGRGNFSFELGGRAGADVRRVSALQAEVVTAEDKLTRLYTTVENDLTDLDDILKERIATLKSDRDRAKPALARITIHPKLDAFNAEAIHLRRVKRAPEVGEFPCCVTGGACGAQTAVPMVKRRTSWACRFRDRNCLSASCTPCIERRSRRETWEPLDGLG